MTEDRMSEFVAAFTAGMMTAPQQNVDGIPYALVPDAATLECLEHMASNPAGKRGTARLEDVDSLCVYVNQHKTKASVIFADPGQHRMTAVIDHHEHGESGMPAWGRHRAILELPIDPDFAKWRKYNDTPMSQIDFAQFVEDMLPTFKTPDGADLLELAQHLEATSKRSFKSAERLSDGGRSILFHEETDKKIGNAKLELPDQFEIRCPVYFRHFPVEMKAKLRIRVHEHKVLLFYHLHRIEETIERAFNDLRGIVEKEAALPVLVGSPPARSEYGL